MPMETHKGGPGDLSSDLLSSWVLLGGEIPRMSALWWAQNAPSNQTQPGPRSTQKNLILPPTIINPFSSPAGSQVTCPWGMAHHEGQRAGDPLSDV